MSTPRITAFTDCASQDIVIRVPYELAVQLVANAPDSDDKQELVHRMYIAAQRSSMFKKMLTDANITEIVGGGIPFKPICEHCNCNGG